MHDKVVPLKSRLKDGHRRNTPDYETDSQLREKMGGIDCLIYELEKEIQL